MSTGIERRLEAAASRGGSQRCPRCHHKGFMSGNAPCAACGWQDPVLAASVPSNWYPDPANPGMTRYWHAALGIWVGRPKHHHTWPIPTEPSGLPSHGLTQTQTVATEPSGPVEGARAARRDRP